MNEKLTISSVSSWESSRASAPIHLAGELAEQLGDLPGHTAARRRQTKLQNLLNHIAKASWAGGYPSLADAYPRSSRRLAASGKGRSTSDSPPSEDSVGAEPRFLPPQADHRSRSTRRDAYFASSSWSAERVEDSGRRRDRIDLITGALEQNAQRLQHVGLIVRDQDSAHAFTLNREYRAVSITRKR